MGYSPENQHGTQKWSFGRWFSSSSRWFSGSMLVFGGVHNTGECFWGSWPYQLVQDFFGTNSSIVFDWKFRVTYFLMREIKQAWKRRGAISWPSTDPFENCMMISSRKLDAIFFWMPKTSPLTWYDLFLFLPEASVCLHPGRLTWNLRIDPWKGKSSSKPSFSGSMLIFGGVRWWFIYFRPNNRSPYIYH